MLYCPVLWVTGGQRVLEKLPTSDYSLKVHQVQDFLSQMAVVDIWKPINISI